MLRAPHTVLLILGGSVGYLFWGPGRGVALGLAITAGLIFTMMMRRVVQGGDD